MILQIEINKRDRLFAKIDELKCMLADGTINGTNRVDRVVTDILKYIDQLQSLDIIIAQALRKVIVPIGDTEISLDIAMEINEALKNKIDILNVVINSGDGIDVLDTIMHRDRIAAEYDNMCDIITMAAWKTELS